MSKGSAQQQKIRNDVIDCLTRHLDRVRGAMEQGSPSQAKQLAKVFLNEAHIVLRESNDDTLLLDVEDLINELLHEVMPPAVRRRGNAQVIDHVFEHVAEQDA